MLSLLDNKECRSLHYHPWYASCFALSLLRLTWMAAQARDPLALGLTLASLCQAPGGSRSTCHMQAGLHFFCLPQGTHLHSRGRRLEKASSHTSMAACQPLQHSEAAH